MRRSGLLIALVLVLALPGVGTPLAAAGRVTVTQVTVKIMPGRVQVGIEATGPVEYRTMTLDDPDRVVVDIPDAINGVVGGVLPVHQGPVQQIRISQFTTNPPAVRVVVDLARPVKYEVSALRPATVVIGFFSPGSQPAPLNRGAGSPQTSSPDQTSGVPVTAGPVSGITVSQVGATPGDQRLNLDLRDAALPDVLDALARLCGVNLVTDTSVGGRVTIHLVGVTCQEAMNFLLEANGLGYRRVGETLIVQPASKLAPPPPGPVVRVYRLRYLQPPISGSEPLVGALGGAGAGGSGVAGGAGPVKKDVGTLLDLFKGTGATLGYDDRTNALVVTGTPDQQDGVVTLLRQLDVPIPQVLVEAVVVDITSTKLTNLGIDWSVLNGFSFSEIAAPPAGQFGIQPVVRQALVAQLQAFITQGYAKVLSDPRVGTFDGQEALIFAGDQIPIVNTTTAGNPPVTTQTVTFQPIGVTLKIIPKINADRSVTVQVHPVVTTATSFTPATSGNPGGLPIIAIREAVTSMQVADGNSLILGGLMRYSDIKNIKKLPFLGDLPLIGELFRLTNVTHSESEVVIIMTPRILTMPAPAPAGG